MLPVTTGRLFLTGNGQGIGVVDGGNTANITVTATGLTAATIMMLLFKMIVEAAILGLLHLLLPVPRILPSHGQKILKVHFYPFAGQNIYRNHT